jgi:hypothetical protein
MFLSSVLLHACFPFVYLPTVMTEVWFGYLFALWCSYRFSWVLHINLIELSHASTPYTTTVWKNKGYVHFWSSCLIQLIYILAFGFWDLNVSIIFRSHTVSRK